MRKNREKGFLVFDINNEQRCYASCLEIIKLLDSTDTIDIAGMDSYLKDFLPNCRMTWSDSMPLGTAGSYRWIEEPIQMRNRSMEENNAVFLEYRRQMKRVDRGVYGEILRNRTNLHYHIRVHFNWEEQSIRKQQLLNLQYLALLLSRLGAQGFFLNKTSGRAKASVFLMPTDHAEYPFDKTGTDIMDDFQNTASQYLRMIAKQYKGVIYCASSSNGQLQVSALDLEERIELGNYFPILAIGKGLYERIFSERRGYGYYQSLLSTAGDSFGDSADREPSKAIPDFIALSAMRKLQRSIESPGETVLPIIEKSKGLSIMRFCIFSFLVTGDDDVDEKWKLAEEIESGIRQVVQNSVQHSEYNGCIFSFCLHETELHDETGRAQNELMHNYPGMESIVTNGSAALEILVSDLNEREDMLENFRKNLQGEMELFPEETGDEYRGHEALISSSDRIHIRNFFSEFEESDLKDAWKEFRMQDAVSHVGLSLMALTAEKCKAAIRVASCSVCRPAAGNCFYKAFGQMDNVQEPEKQGIIIPGTQFSVLIPANLFDRRYENSMGQMNLKEYICEDYQCFADYIDYEEFPICISENEFRDIADEGEKETGAGIVSTAQRKSEAVVRWFHFWEEFFNDKCRHGTNTVNRCDMNNLLTGGCFSQADAVEVCMKGLMMALSHVTETESELLVALLNLPEGFIAMFCSISTLIGVRQLPAKIQLYLREESGRDSEEAKELVFTGTNFTQAMCRSYVLSVEHGSKGCPYGEYRKSMDLYARLMPDEADFWKEGEKCSSICPFDVILQSPGAQEATIFETTLHGMAELQLDGHSKGYKLIDTHMRLGSKVHIESFYEMSFLFYRTSVANRIAFLILRDIRNAGAEDFSIERDPVIFFGYASYSKAILTSLSEMLRIYRREHGGSGENLVGIASYQHNLQSESSDIQMYFEMDEDVMGVVQDGNMLRLCVDVNVIQIVPISTTLTTFAKMWSEFLDHVDNEGDGKVILRNNYTLFWVTDKDNKEDGIYPSEIEAKYWSSVTGRIIETNFKNLEIWKCKNIRYFINSSVAWNHPLTCGLCFPDNAIDEIPLVETDATSTVPALQIRYTTNEHAVDTSSEAFRKSIGRLQLLKGCIMEGHIVRRRNHFQYYIDTQKYFRNARDEVAKWLAEEVPGRSQLGTRDFPTLHIIFSPEHNTNVGFAQYVNTYYFGGLAEIVSVNIDKEFRSNFVCEHSALMNTIQSLHQIGDGREDSPVHFYFVDDSITTGETFEKANSLLHSLIPSDIKHSYHANLFDKVFLLVDRMSKDTRRMYVEKMEENFHAFVHIDVSNMRTQGDSCVGCKLRKGAERMFKRSATRHQAEHWAQQLEKYRKIPFDNLDEMDQIDKEESYRSMMTYHMLQNVIIKDGNSYEVGKAYDVLLDLLEYFVSDGRDGDMHGYQDLFDGMQPMGCVTDILKIISRPFFSYDYKIKLQVLTIYVCMTELMFGVPIGDILSHADEESAKAFLYDCDRGSRTDLVVNKIKDLLSTEKEKLLFIEDCLMDGLAEMGSTFLMRKETMQKAYRHIANPSGDISSEDVDAFWEKYALNLHRILSNTKDETKEHWLEYLYTMGREYPKKKNALPVQPLDRISELPAIYGEAAEDGETEDDAAFRRFVMEVFLQNTGVKFDGMEKLAHISGDDSRESNISDEYFMDSWREMRMLEQYAVRHTPVNGTEELEKKLFLQLEEKSLGTQEGGSVTKWYRDFLGLLSEIAEKKYGIPEDTIEKFLITDNSRKEVADQWIPELNITSEPTEADSRAKQEARYLAKKRLETALKQIQDGESQLEKYGYYISDSGKGDSFFIIFFDNPRSHETLAKQGYNLARVFLYMGFKNSEGKPMGIRYLMRDILTYRYRFLSILSQDFNGDIFSSYAKSNDERNILSHEKAASHSASTDDAISTELFIREMIEEIEERDIYRYLSDSPAPHLEKSYWLLIRNYTNNQIARLFNRSFRGMEHGEIPPLYLTADMGKKKKGAFGQKLMRYSDLNITDSTGRMDRRFEIIGEAMDIKSEVEEDAEFVNSPQGLYYNLEYFRCIIIDGMISAIKYQSTEKDDYLLRIEELLKWKAYSGNGKREKEPAAIRIYRSEGNADDSDYLVIENKVNKWAHGLVDCEAKNKEIEMRLADPLDFIDGHMSMLTTKRYVENLKAVTASCRFYYEMRNISGRNEMYFMSCLPVLKRKETIGNGGRG